MVDVYDRQGGGDAEEIAEDPCRLAALREVVMSGLLYSVSFNQQLYDGSGSEEEAGRVRRQWLLRYIISSNLQLRS